MMKLVDDPNRKIALAKERVGERQERQAQTGRLARFVDWGVSAISPKRAFVREFYRQRRAQFSYRGTLNGRLDRAGSRVQGGRGRFDIDLNTDLLADRALALVESNPIAKGFVDKLQQLLIGTGIRFIAKTANKSFNSQHADLWAQWSDECDIRGMSSLGSLQNMIVQGMFTQNRTGCIFLKSGQLQLVEGTMIQTPPGKENEPIVSGVEMNAVGRPIAFHVLIDDDSPLDKYVRVPARDFVYFPLRWRFGDSVGATIFAQSYDNLEQVDATIEAVTSAAQMAASLALLVKKEGAGGYEEGTEPGVDSQGNNARLMNIEAASIEFLQLNESIEQVKGEHPKEHLGDFVKQNLRYAFMTSGVPLEILVGDLGNANYSVSRAMKLAAYEWADWWYANQVQRNFARIYKWRTSKWIKEGVLKDRKDAWKHRHIKPIRPLIDEGKDLQADATAMDLNARSIIEIAERTGRTATEMLDEVKEGLEMLEARGLATVKSSATREEGTETQATTDQDE